MHFNAQSLLHISLIFFNVHNALRIHTFTHDLNCYYYFRINKYDARTHIQSLQ